MKRWFYIGIVLMVVLAGCGYSPDSPALTGTPSQRGTASRTLENIDSLMWRQPDSAFAMLQEFALSATSDSLDEFNGHYCQLLVSELLFKNYYAQSNRKDLKKAVDYFDSIDDGFLAARAHYMNGVGFYERDSLIEACGEYLNALRMMERHFAEKDLVGHKARFMALTFNRLGDLFSAQFMQEPAIYCYKQALVYNRIAPTSPYGSSNNLYRIGKQYGKLEMLDSASYYFDKALDAMPNRNNLIYRDIVTSRALSDFYALHDTLITLDSLKSMAAQAENETERLNRFLTIGGVYQSIRQYDSVRVYLDPVLESKDKAINTELAAKALREIAISEGDTLKANEYALILVNNGSSAADNQAQVSKLNDIFQSYLQEKQEAASLRERREAIRLTLLVLVPLLVAIGLAVVLVMRCSHKKRLATQEAEAQRRLDEASQRLAEASQRHNAAERVLQTKVEQAAQHTREMLQQRAMAIYHSKEKDKLQIILNEFATTYPQASEQLLATSDLKEQERNIIVLSFIQFRAKEMAELLGLSENTVLQYRSNIKKKMGSDPVSDLIG